jgi:hypothetical protein
MSFSGTFIVDETLTISPGLTKEKLKNYSKYKDQDFSRPFMIYKPTLIYDHKFLLELHFGDVFISVVHLKCMDEIFDDGVLADEKQRSLFHKDFIATYAPECKYDWGEVNYYLNEEYYTSSIAITYSEEYQKKTFLTQPVDT